MGKNIKKRNLKGNCLDTKLLYLVKTEIFLRVGSISLSDSQSLI